MAKQKMKTHRAGAKRFRITAGGKILRNQSNRNHINTKKPSHRKRRLDHVTQVDDTNLAKIALELPYPKYSRK